LLRTISRKTGYDIDIHHEESLGLLRIVQKSPEMRRVRPLLDLVGQA